MRNSLHHKLSIRSGSQIVAVPVCDCEVDDSDDNDGVDYVAVAARDITTRNTRFTEAHFNSERP